MKSRPSIALFNRASHCLNIALVSAIIIQIVLYINRTVDNSYSNSGLAVEEILYLTSLVLLIGVVCSRYIYNVRLIRQAEAGKEQLDAMISMFSGVKHKLNNDMQVVLGNAELAEILVHAGGDVFKPVQNITAAANHAVERIEQLSVFGSTGCPNPALVDLNAMFRQTMAKMAEELPPLVTLRLELEHLSSRVVVDRCLLSLSLSHLIRLSVSDMRHGGEIVIRTSDYHDKGDGVETTVVARIYIVRTLSQSSESDDKASAVKDDEKIQMSKNVELRQSGLNTIKALVERSGVESVKLTRAGDESLFTMRFATDMQTDTVQDDLLVSHLYSL